jgi:hypothetical protein
MAPRHKVTTSTTPTNYRLSSDERRAARLAEIANKQSDLKREAAERRAKRTADAAAEAKSQGPEANPAASGAESGTPEATPDQVQSAGPSDSD